MNVFNQLEKPSLLLVDDDKEFISALSQAMEKRGFEVITVDAHLKLTR